MNFLRAPAALVLPARHRVPVRCTLRLDRQALPATLLRASAHLALAVATSLLYVFTSVLTGRLIEAPSYQKEPLLRLTAVLLGKTADTSAWWTLPHRAPGLAAPPMRLPKNLRGPRIFAQPVDLIFEHMLRIKE